MILLDLWAEHKQSIIMIGGAILTFTAGALVIWTQLKPIRELLGKLFDKAKETEVTDVSKLLQQNDMATKITDLKVKLENPTISDENKKNYMIQLQVLLEVQAKLDVGLAKAEEINNTYL